jgi:outer membrane protein assembly factor BamD (BamD/ComL family)
MAMDKETRKKWIIGVIIAVILIVPLLLLSNWGLGMFEGYAVENSTEEWAANMQLNCAKLYGITLRGEKEIEAYERFYKHFTTHPKRGYAKYMVAVCIERDIERSRGQAIRAYEDFLDEFEDDPVFQRLPDWQMYVQEAERAIFRIQNSPT